MCGSACLFDIHIGVTRPAYAANGIYIQQSNKLYWQTIYSSSTTYLLPLYIGILFRRTPSMHSMPHNKRFTRKFITSINANKTQNESNRSVNRRNGWMSKEASNSTLFVRCWGLWLLFHSLYWSINGARDDDEIVQMDFYKLSIFSSRWLFAITNN